MRLQACACFGFRLRGGGDGDAALGGVRHDGFGKRMGGVLLHGGGSLKQRIFADIRRSPDGGDVGLALRERACFVQHHGVNMPRLLHGGGVFEPHAMSHGNAHARHDAGGRCQAQRAGASHHQHGNGVHKGFCCAACEQPCGDKGKRGDGQHGGHEHGGDFICQPRDGGFAALRV